MTFGAQADEKMSLRILDQSFDAGINFYDTAENYPVPPDPKWAGRTEEIVGKWLATKDRDAIILATKVCGPSHGWLTASQRAGMTALDRHNITRAVEASLSAWGQTTSISTKHIGRIMARPSTKRWKPSTISSALAKYASSAAAMRPAGAS